MDEPRLVVPIEDEPLDAYLSRRERELVQQVAALLGALVPKQNELEAVRKTMESRGLPHHGGTNYTDALAPFLKPNEEQAENPLLSYAPAINALAQASNLHTPPSFGLAALGLTIKQMIVRALKDHFHDGASPVELRDYMRTAYGREIDRNSISPQLSRLRDEGIVEQPPGMLNEGKWHLKRDALRRQVWYGGDDK